LRPLPDPDARVVVDVGGAPADLTTVEALVRLELTARRRGCRVCLCGASPELAALLALCGLTEVLPDG
jgi:anti-anti-sigma regulatory factor